MNREERIKALMNPATVLFTVIVIFSFVSLSYTSSLVNKSQQHATKQRQLLTVAHQRYYKSGEEKNIILKYREGFEQLQKRGFVGAERRIDWIDAIRNANQRLRLGGIEYHIAAQRSYPFKNHADLGGYELKHSTMDVKLKLLHEEDLIRFFADLESQQAGLFVIQSCDIQRIGEPAGEPSLIPYLQGQCQLAWLTLVEHSA